MNITVYTTTGCTRCKIVKAFMEERNISYEEKDMKAQGKEDFQVFYKENRSSIFRGPDGIEFPIITDSSEIRQGIGASIAYLQAGKNLEEFFTVGTLHKEWVNGIHVSGGRLEWADDFIQVLSYLKGSNMKLQVDTNGKNSSILQQIQLKGLADLVVMNLLGPEEIYNIILGGIDIEDIKKSLSLITQFPEYRIETTILPVEREGGTFSYLTPQEICETAKLISEITGSNKIPYLIKGFNLSPSQLLTYRSKARAYQVFTEIEK
ncbi:MAG: glutaredoxin domain-containing protein [Bacillota bacterium]